MLIEVEPDSCSTRVGSWSNGMDGERRGDSTLGARFGVVAAVAFARFFLFNLCEYRSFIRSKRDKRKAHKNRTVLTTDRSIDIDSFDSIDYYWLGATSLDHTETNSTTSSKNNSSTSTL